MKALLCGLAFCFLTSLCSAAEPTLKLDLGGGVGLDLVLIPAGNFTQGSPANEAGRASDETQRQVTISKQFYFGRTAVTRAQWERFIAETHYMTEAEGGTSGGYGWTGSGLEQRKEFTWRNPGFAQTPEHPVCLVTFPDAQAFCAWLEKKSGRKVSLPTEAQWEYACRAGTPGPFRGLDAFATAWHKDNAGNGTRPADSRTPNPWGLVIGGNVSEWCLDWYGPYPAGAATDPLQQNQNLSDKPRRILRGGSWIRGASNTRSAARYRADPRSRNADIGFRILCSAEAPAPAKVTPPPPPPTPPVEVESSRPAPVTPAPPVTTPPATHHESAPAVSRSPIGTLLGGLLCFLLPVGVIIAIVFAVVKRRNISASAGNPADRFLHPTPPPRAFSSAPIRKGDDGFWIQGDWPEGTALKLRYMVAGVAMVQEILYRPGAEGQFIYTGREPDSISVLAGNDPTNTVEPGLFGGPAIPTTGYRDRDDDDDRRRSVPPTRPSAY
ncbi:SUMF1/EgtB/PvdO family nonheme iron enzyme [Haloferula sp. BvORR071]|uniref:formylglycine-generating enzyme family protein n=1 Tax=Haloferula sp. BvORR071 TaxID=1396141 RepID=UPI0006991239|nr:SUMF1/EgtB/PvdO family nonheme iron enzyme [Haloferula sp. BvORR071]